MKQLLQSIDGNRICLGVSNVNEHEILRSLPIRINAQGRRHGNAAQEKRESDTPGCDRKDVAGVKPQKIEQLFSFFFLFCFFRKNYNTVRLTTIFMRARRLSHTIVIIYSRACDDKIISHDAREFFLL